MPYNFKIAYFSPTNWTIWGGGAFGLSSHNKAVLTASVMTSGLSLGQGSLR